MNAYLWVDVAEPWVWWQCDDGKRWDNDALKVPELVEASKCNSAVNGMCVVALFMPFLSGPFMKAAGRNHGPLGVKRFFQSELVPRLPDRTLKVLYFGEGQGNPPEKQR